MLCKTKCFFDMKLTYKSATLNHYLSINTDNMYYIDKDLTSTVNCYLNPNTNVVQLYAKAYTGSAHIIVYPEKSRNATSVLIDSRNFDIDATKLGQKSKLLDINIQVNEGQKEMVKMLSSSLITHDKPSIIYYKISESQNYMRMDSNSLISLNIPIDHEFKGYFPIDNNVKSILLNIQTKSIKVMEFTFFAKFVKVNKKFGNKSEDFNDLPNFVNSIVYSDYILIIKKVYDLLIFNY